MDNSRLNSGQTVSRAELVAQFKQLTELSLPERACLEHWPLRLDHCFKRICLDWACGGCWYNYIERPAERKADLAQLGRAVQCAEEILAGGIGVLRSRNAASLGWRGKLIPGTAAASEGKEI